MDMRSQTLTTLFILVRLFRTRSDRLSRPDYYKYLSGSLEGLIK